MHKLKLCDVKEEVDINIDENVLHWFHHTERMGNIMIDDGFWCCGPYRK